MKKTASDLETPTKKMKTKSSADVTRAQFFGTRMLGARFCGTQFFGAALTLASFSLSAICLLQATTASAQHGPVQRTVDGVVQNNAGGSVKGAVVYLKDTKSLSVKSFVSTDAGTFHFSQLSPDTDYDVWAELQGKKSKTRSISQFNSKTQFTYTLKIED